MKQRTKIGKKVFLKNANFKNSTPISQILGQLRKKSEDALQTQTRTIRMMRGIKEKQGTSAKTIEIDHQSMKPTDAIPRVFSSSKPLNIGDRYLNEQQKSKVLLSERAFNRSANIVTGVYRERIRTQTQKQKKNWINRKFCDYDNIVTAQSGPMRILAKQRISQQRNLYEKRPIYSGQFQTKTNLFSDYQSDQNNFFKQIGNARTMDTIHSKFRTEASLETSPLSKVLRTGPRKNKGEFKSTISRNFSHQSDFFD